MVLLFRVEVIRLERRLYPCKDLSEQPVLYPDARHENGRIVLQGAIFLPLKLPDGKPVTVFSSVLPVCTAHGHRPNLNSPCLLFTIL